ncbi:hypothetical protein LshimejAT787_0603340 [Lyophyllum shimeji]|uniref:Uncharacterized protein n=1 Tax=Lyophyllum shimeji TaxID=47721 RepID=A0A9P3PMP1_LYOSH|nr:hypothetical protein LshimejAT787_0603340 [Lyophyllum shimeji]
MRDTRRPSIIDSELLSSGRRPAYHCEGHSKASLVHGTGLRTDPRLPCAQVRPPGADLQYFGRLIFIGRGFETSAAIKFTDDIQIGR